MLLIAPVHVNFLVRAETLEAVGDVAGDDDDGRPVQGGVAQRGHRVQHAWSERGDDHTRAVRDSEVGVGRVSGDLLVMEADESDAALDEGVEDG